MNATTRLTLIFCLGISSSAFAQQPAKRASVAPKPAAQPSEILPGRPDADVDDALGAELLGPEWSSKGHGISLRPPKDTTPVRRLGSQDIIEFVNEEKGVTLKLSKIMLDEPGALTEHRDKHGALQPGLLEYTAQRLKENQPDAQFLRQEQINIADADVGVLALRYTRNLKPLLAQQAIIQRTDQLYYLLALTTPGAAGTAGGAAGAEAKKDAKADAKEEAPIVAGSERVAAEMFRQILDSVKLLDLRHIRLDQNERLIRTRGLLVTLTPERIRDKLIDQQWIRVLRNGKDVGYTYVSEKTSGKSNQDGVEIRIRSRMRPGGDVQIDSGSILYASMDLRHEDWSTVTELASIKLRAAGVLADGNPYKPPHTTESGMSDRRSVPGHGDIYAFQVMFESKHEPAKPVVRDLPPFYMPQAISHMLHRLVPDDDPKTYMFMVWVPETREVMARYLDVLPSEKVQFNDKLVRAVRVLDRIGLEGQTTTHYISSDHVWIGSENKESGVMTLPTTEATLMALWKDANLTAPEAPAFAPKKDAAKPRAAADDAAGSDKKRAGGAAARPVDARGSASR